MLKRVLETLDGLDEPIKALYKPHNGKFVLDVDDAAELKTSLQKAREEADSLKAKLRGLDIDNDEYKKLKEELQKREAEEAKKRGDYDALEAQLKENHAKELKAMKDELKALRQARESAFMEAEITSAIASAKGIPGLLGPIIQKHVKAEEKDGKLQLVVLGQDGKARFKDGQGAPFTLADLVSELKADETFGRAFEGTGATGGGTHPGGASANTSGARARYDALMAKQTLTQAERFEVVNLAGQLRQPDAPKTNTTP